MSDPTRRWLLPPVFALGYGLGFVGGPVWLGIRRDLPRGCEWAGLGVEALAVALGLSAILAFRRAGTTPEPNGTPAALVTAGPFRFTRNPMYLALTTVLAGLALWVGRTAAFAAPVAFFLTVRAIFVPREEARLEALFGDAFRAYRGRVRRWL